MEDDLSRSLAVIEGTSSREEKTPHYLLTELIIGENVTTLQGGPYTFQLYGSTLDFTHLDVRSELSEEGVLARIRDMSVIQTQDTEVGQWRRTRSPYRPRAVISSDGRIFLEEDSQRSEYLSLLSEIVRRAGEVFKDERLKKGIKPDSYIPKTKYGL